MSMNNYSQYRNLIDRYDLGEVSKPNIWFRYRGWSVLNAYELHKSFETPYLKADMFNYWEAMKYDENNEQIIIREDTLKKLLHKIDNMLQ